jgi:phospholipid/cholesterol/gamma-HCH transport system substrate-binding protein
MSQTIRLGAFVLVTLAILGFFVFLVGSMESRFESHYQLRAQFPNVKGLYEGADVRVGGIRKGTVRRIELPGQPDGKVTVVMDLAKATQNLVKQDSVASIKTEGLLGDKYVEVSFGSAEAARIKSGETIGSEPPLDISDLYGKADQILDTTQAALQNVQAASGDLSGITSKINQGRGTIGALVNDKSVYQQAAAGVTALNEDAEALKHNFLLRGFFRNRGYEDAAEVAKHQVAQLPAQSPQKAFAYDSNKVFDKPDSAKLKNQKVLNEAGKYLETERFGLAVIKSSTGMKGDSAKAQELTQARAYVAREYMVQNFKVDDQRIKTMGAGKSQDGTDQLEILVYSAGPQAPSDSPSPARKN